MSVGILTASCDHPCEPFRRCIKNLPVFLVGPTQEAGVSSIVNMSQISARWEAKSHAAQNHRVPERVFKWPGACRPYFAAKPRL